MKILFVWRSIHGVAGGVERFMSLLMNHLAEKGHFISLLTWDHGEAVSHYPLHPNIGWTKMDIGDPVEKGDWHTRLRRMNFVRAYIKADKPDVILCFESGIFLSMRLFLWGSNIPMISAERNSPSRHQFSDRAYKKQIVFLSLFLADRITTQFERYRQGYPFYLRGKITAIPNPVRTAQVFALPRGKEGAQKTLLCVSRLSAHQKNLQVLVYAFSMICPSLPEWRLIIAGDGEEQEKSRIMHLIENLQLKERITLTGKVQDVESLYAASHLFCLPSRYEGFPNALAEALVHGLPCVGFKDCAGVADLIQNGITGLLAEGNDNAKCLASSLYALMYDAEMRERMGSAARESMRPYAPENVFAKWESFLANTVKSKSA